MKKGHLKDKIDLNKLPHIIYTTEEVAYMFRVSKYAVYKWIYNGIVIPLRRKNAMFGRIYFTPEMIKTLRDHFYLEALSPERRKGAVKKFWDKFKSEQAKKELEKINKSQNLDEDEDE